MRLPRLRSAFWLLPGMLLGAVLLVAVPLDIPPRPLRDGDVEAEVWAAAIRHLAQQEGRVDVLDPTIPDRLERTGGVQEPPHVRRFVPEGTPISKGLLTRHHAALRPRRRVGEALALRGQYRLVPADSASRAAAQAWIWQRDSVRLSVFPWLPAGPDALVILGRATISENGRQALLETASVCGSVCGKGELLLLSRGTDGWKVVASEGLWVS